MENNWFRKIFILMHAKVYAREIYQKGQFAKVYAREMQKFREFFDSRNFVPAKVCAPKVAKREKTHT